MAKSRKRPVYLVVKPLGVKTDDGKEAVSILSIKQTKAGADTECSKHEGATVMKGNVEID
jgi:hypothetical protein